MFSFIRKWLGYHVKEYTDPLAVRRLKEIGNVWDQHKTELEDFWRSTSTDECANLVVAFLEELRREWPKEFKELNPKGLPDAISEGFRSSIKQAYVVGYMTGKGWISEEHRVDFNIYLGDKLARDIRSVLKGAKSRGIAFASGFVAVAVHGHLKVLQSVAADSTLAALNTDKPTYEPSKYEILNNILLTEGNNLLSKHFKHPELLGRPTYISVDPFNRSDYDYLISAFLAGRIGHFNAEKLESIFKKLLQDDYDEYYEAAKKRIIDSNQ